MATSYKVLGQVLPGATTLTTLYTVPALTSSVCSTLSICNQGASTTYRIAIRPSGVAITASQYVVYDATLNANDTVFLTLGVTLGSTDVVSVYAGTSNVSFHLYGSEIT
jgi:hypothetical protein